MGALWMLYRLKALWICTADYNLNIIKKLFMKKSGF